MNTAGSYLLSKRFYIVVAVIAIWAGIIVLCFYKHIPGEAFAYLTFATPFILGVIAGYLGLQSWVQKKQNDQTASVTQTVGGVDTKSLTTQESAPTPPAPEGQ